LDTGGAPELPQHETTGYVARFGDVDDLARGLAWVTASPERLAALGGQARALAEAEHDEALMQERYLRLYETVIAERGG
jgi:glycosyltransferase involved in cell wall biosynthesis